MSVSTHKDRKYQIVSYDVRWVEIFREEEKKLRLIFSDRAIDIEHIGGTSVPGLAGKPTVDILILVESVSVAEEVKDEMKNVGYIWLGDYTKKGSGLFAKESNGARKINVHIFPKEHFHVREMLRIRNYFRTHPESVQEYSKLKLSLVKKYPEEYEKYRKLKDEWMKTFMVKVNTFYENKEE